MPAVRQPGAKTGFFKMTRPSIGGILSKNESADNFKKSIVESRQGVKEGRLTVRKSQNPF